MATIDLMPGGSGPFVIRPIQPDGTVPDLAGSALQLRINAGAVCLIVNGVIAPDGFELDLDSLELAPRLHPADLWINWGQGWRWHGKMALNVKRRC